ncbi:MAG TPA: lyase family protein [Gaiellaceae bacterium]
MPSDDLFRSIFVPSKLRAAVGGKAWLQAMLDAEGALARAEARAGLIPADAADAITACCRADLFDVASIGEQGHAVANPAEPLVRALRERAGDAGRWVHHGATSQDIVDSAAMLVSKRARVLVLEESGGVAGACARLAGAHRGTVMAARTLLQQAVPTTFGLKAAGWLVGVVEARRRLAAVETAAQLGGAAGTLGAFGEKGIEVLGLFAEELELAEPALPWHANRTRIAELGAALELVAGACGKIALDVILLAQTEIAEISVPWGGSSAMPHKRNPAGAVVAAAAARQAARTSFDLLHEHERAAGAWQAEWTALSDALAFAGGTAAAVRETLEGLEVNGERMRANLDPVLAAEVEAGLASVDRLVDRALDLYRHA